MNLQRCLMLAFVLSLSACEGESPASTASVPASAQPANPALGDPSKCPLRAADLDKLTSYRWRFAQYKADQSFIAGIGIRYDFCELIGRDDKGQMRGGVMVNIATGAQADAFAKHWHTACADSIMRAKRGKVQPVPGVPGGQQCVTASGESSFYWLESPGRTIEIQPIDEDTHWAKTLPQLLAAIAK